MNNQFFIYNTLILPNNFLDIKIYLYIFYLQFTIHNTQHIEYYLLVLGNILSVTLTHI